MHSFCFRQIPGAVLAISVAMAGGCDKKSGEPAGGDDDDVGHDDDDDTGHGGDDDDAGDDDDDASDGGDDDDTPDNEWVNQGECRIQGSGKWEAGAYAGTVDYVLLADKGDGDELCRMKFDLQTVGEPDIPCDFCYWSTVAQLSNPTVITQVDDKCSDSDRGLDAATVEVMLTTRTGMGFAEEATGHGQILVHYDEVAMTWAAAFFGVWDESTGELSYDKVEGFCFY